MVVSFSRDSYPSKSKIFSIERLISILPESVVKKSEDDVEIFLEEDSTVIDERILLDVLKNYEGASVSVKFLGGINGTVPLKVIINGGRDEKVYCVPDQGIRGVNCTTSRPLRKKVFDRIREEFPNLIHAQFFSFVELLKTEAIRNICLTYGESSKKLHRVDNCPVCSSNFSTPLHVGEGNSITGFLDASHKVYRYCNFCTLVYLSLQVERKDLGIFYTESSYKRSNSENIILENWKNLNEATTSHFGNYKVGLNNIKSHDSVLDLGCGSGDFLSIVRDHHPNAVLTGVDFFIPSPILNAFSKKNIFGQSADLIQYIQAHKKSTKFDVVTMWEVIEHLKVKDLRLLLKSIRDILNPGGRLIFSTPDFFDDHCRSLDFWAMAPGEHLYVYNLNLCRKILSEAGFKIHLFERESVTTKLPNRWYKYGALTNSTLSGRSSAAIVESFLSCQELRDGFKKQNKKEKIGSELIVVAV
tara:strand:+ start:264 stop:1679 length:1416 start_codon:yes stop_codon:yes gene_type:complete